MLGASPLNGTHSVILCDSPEGRLGSRERTVDDRVHLTIDNGAPFIADENFQTGLDALHGT
jgi:hypothetical protein